MSAEKSSWERFGDNATLSRFRQRTIDNTVAPLRRYLGSGMTVLDVGCGPGALTLDAAAVVAPGAVAGIDLSRSAVSQAEESARAAGLSNVSFQVADAYSIPFEDGTFDLTYSHSILEYLREPSRALAEQVRVTKPGGRVIAAVLVTGGLIIYPPAPALLRLFHARFDYIGAHPDDSTFPYMSRDIAENGLRHFFEAGLGEIAVEGYFAPIDCAHQGSQYFEYNYGKLALPFTEGTPIAEETRMLVERGAIDESLLSDARRELDAWRADPCAIFLRSEILFAGRVR